MPYQLDFKQNQTLSEKGVLFSEDIQALDTLITSLDATIRGVNDLSVPATNNWFTNVSYVINGTVLTLTSENPTLTSGFFALTRPPELNDLVLNSLTEVTLNGITLNLEVFKLNASNSRVIETVLDKGVEISNQLFSNLPKFFDLLTVNSDITTLGDFNAFILAGQYVGKEEQDFIDLLNTLETTKTQELNDVIVSQASTTLQSAVSLFQTLLNTYSNGSVDIINAATDLSQVEIVPNVGRIKILLTNILANYTLLVPYLNALTATNNSYVPSSDTTTKIATLEQFVQDVNAIKLNADVLLSTTLPTNTAGILDVIIELNALNARITTANTSLVNAYNEVFDSDYTYINDKVTTIDTWYSTVNSVEATKTIEFINSLEALKTLHNNALTTVRGVLDNDLSTIAYEDVIGGLSADDKITINQAIVDFNTRLDAFLATTLGQLITTKQDIILQRIIDRNLINATPAIPTITDLDSSITTSIRDLFGAIPTDFAEETGIYYEIFLGLVGILERYDINFIQDLKTYLNNQTIANTSPTHIYKRGA